MSSIQFVKETKTFILSNQQISYILGVEEGVLIHYYFGKCIKNFSNVPEYPQNINQSFSPRLSGAENEYFSLNNLPQEYPGNNQGDYRTPANEVTHANGSTVTDFRYHSFKIIQGKPELDGLPATYADDDSEAETLIIKLVDAVSSMELYLSYTIFAAQSVIVRSARYVNAGTEDCRIEKAMSSSIDFPYAERELFFLSGAWANERNLIREPIMPGTKQLGSVRGASSHAINPFLGIGSKHFTESVGEVYGFSLVYSGNHEMIVEEDQIGQCRVQLGINSHDFSWQLKPGDDFQTPEVVMGYSEEGLGKLSSAFHELFNQHLVRGRYKNETRPVLINNWEATYFDFDAQKILDIAKASSELGVELFVLDDGWFGHRENDRSSLGDWFVNEEKLPGGLDGISKAVHQLGMKFGLWFEPEMISEDSELFKRHPDWILKTPGYPASLGRNQYVLDFSRQEVRDNIYQQMKKVLDSAAIDYIKWDMNRNMSEVYSSALGSTQQGEVYHRYILGLYEFLERLTSECPNILFESCSGGGGRFDPGMLYYMPQTWTSDNTDAISRLKIQYGTSIVYPVSTMGAHVSTVPNHQTGRVTPFEVRGDVAMSGVLGYELNVTKLSEKEKKEMKQQISFYKKHRELIQFGDFYRLLSPFEGAATAWQFVSRDKKEALVIYVKAHAEAAPHLNVLKLAGLTPEKMYLDESGKQYSGDELMLLGLFVENLLKGEKTSEYQSCCLYLKA